MWKCSRRPAATWRRSVPPPPTSSRTPSASWSARWSSWPRRSPNSRWRLPRRPGCLSPPWRPPARRRGAKPTTSGVRAEHAITLALQQSPAGGRLTGLLDALRVDALGGDVLRGRGLGGGIANPVPNSGAQPDLHHGGTTPELGSRGSGGGTSPGVAGDVTGAPVSLSGHAVPPQPVPSNGLAGARAVPAPTAGTAGIPVVPAQQMPVQVGFSTPPGPAIVPAATPGPATSGPGPASFGPTSPGSTSPGRRVRGRPAPG